MKFKNVLGILLLSCSESFAGDIAITFDDAPRSDAQVFSGNQRTYELINSLKKAGVDEAMFFLMAKSINDDTIHRVKKYAAAGHILASHSFSHSSANRLSPQDFLIDVAKAHEVLKSLDGFEPWFRFPYLHRGNSVEDRTAINEGLEALGYRDGYVTVDNYDWFMESLLQEALKSGQKVDYAKLQKLYVDVLWQGIEFYDELAQKVLGRSPKHVLLLHENDLAAMYIDELVAHIEQQGWTIIPARAAYGDDISQFAPQQFPGNQGRIAVMAQARGEAPEQLRHPSEDEAYLRDLFKREGVFD